MPNQRREEGASEFESSRIQAKLGRASLHDPGATRSQVPQPMNKHLQQLLPDTI